MEAGITEEQPLIKPKSKLSQVQLEKYLSDMRHEPEWRQHAEKCARYYDGEQRTSSVLNKLKERGLPILTRNEIAPAIDTMLGQEAKNQTRTKVTSDSSDEEVEAVSRALTSEVIKVERQTQKERALSDSYAEMVKTGLSWIEVGHTDNAFLGDLRVQHVKRQEIYWDWRHKRPDLLDARYVIRRQFLDKDIAKNMFPKHKELIEYTLTNWANFDAWENSINHEYLAGCYDLERSQTTIPQDEWVNTDRGRVCVYEVWYRVSESTMVFTDQSGIVREFDKKNIGHAVLVASKAVELSKTITSKVRRAWYIGPHAISDEPSPYNHNFFPYVPVWGFKTDENKLPYCLVSRMISPQDEVNARLSKLMDILSIKRVLAYSDSFDSRYNNMAKVREQIASSNSFILLNPNRKNQNGMSVETDIPLADRQYEMISNASAVIKSISGINSSMQGQFNRSGESGIAVNALIEQGNVGLAELNDNFRWAKTQVSELILAHVKQKIGKKQQNITIAPDENLGNKEETIELNKPAVNDDGMEYLSNSVMQSRTEVELEPIPSHETVKQQQFTDLLDFVKLLPPEYMSAVADKLVLTSGLEFKSEMAEIFRKLSGQNPEDMTPEEQAQAQMQQEQAQLELDKLRLEVQKMQSESTKIDAEAVTKNIESTFSAVQSAGALAMQPELIPVADSILQSAGFVDSNQAPIATVQATDGIQPPQIDQQPLPPGVNMNTSPGSPPVMNSPVDGMNTGIETQTIEDN